MIEVTSRHTDCTHFNSDYSPMPAVALHCVLCCVDFLTDIFKISGVIYFKQLPKV